MSKSTDRQERLSNAVIGLIVICIGFGIVYWFFSRIPHNVRPSLWEWLIIFGPMLIIMGIVMLMRGLLWGQSAFSGRTVLYGGLVMLLIGGFPWIYTPLLIKDHVGEGSGMLGTLLFLIVGIPGLVLTIIGFFIRDW